MTVDMVTELFERRRHAWVNRDVSALAATYSDDCVVETPTAGTLTGRLAVERAERDVFTAFPDIVLEMHDLIVVGDQAVMTATVSGTDQAGILTMPGTHIRFPAVVLYWLQGGHIVRERRLWDFSGFLLERVRRDLETAAEIQQRLLPQGHVVRDRFEIAAASVPCRTIGGDFFDYFDLPDGSFALALGDVAGKGAPAALLSAAAQAILATAPRTGGPAAALTHTNRALLRRAVPARFVTVFHATLSSDGHLVSCNGGHNPPYLVGKNGHRWLRQGGMVLGLFDQAAYEEESVALHRGDRLIVFSDGITEAVDAGGEEFGEDRLVACVHAHASLTPAVLVDRILDTVKQFAAGTTQRDDLTVLVLEYTGQGS